MKYIITALVSALLALLFTKEYYPSVKMTTVHDTITVQPAPIVIEKVRAKLIYKRDTIIKTAPFVATVDTVYKRDTIMVSYSYPENEMNMAIRLATDTVYNEVKTIAISNNKNDWWHTPAAAAGGLLLGIIISK